MSPRYAALAALKEPGVVVEIEWDADVEKFECRISTASDDVVGLGEWPSSALAGAFESLTAAHRVKP
jgi:hypothetical protein